MAEMIVSGRCLLRKHRSPYATLQTSLRKYIGSCLR